MTVHNRQTRNERTTASPDRVAAALAELRLPPSATRAQVRRAYRRLAFAHHPDRNHNTTTSFDRFKRIAGAYRLLEDAAALRELHEHSGTCAKCNRVERLYEALDRRSYCRSCLLTATGYRMLPAPPVVIAGCGLAAALLIASTACAALYVATSQTAYGLASFAASLSALTSLAATAVTVAVTTHPRRTRRGGHRNRAI